MLKRMLKGIILASSTLCLSQALQAGINLKSRWINEKDSSIVVIPFEYKQSALYQTYTMQAIDSVIAILQQNAAVTLSIEGYTHADEGSDTISYYLSLNRALFIRDYVLGRGIDSSRIITIKALGKLKPLYHGVNRQGILRNCRAEIRLNYPPPPRKIVLADKDEDGIADSEDECPDVYGEIAFKGCRNKDAVVIPFETGLSALNPVNYRLLDSIVTVLQSDPLLGIAIEGHASAIEGANSTCEALAQERADIVKNYLLSRFIASFRIRSLKSFGTGRKFSAGKTPREMRLNARAEIIITHP